MDTTRGSLKSQSIFGFENGATNPPDAPSTWIGTKLPVRASYSSSSCAPVSAHASTANRCHTHVAHLLHGLVVARVGAPEDDVHADRVLVDVVHRALRVEAVLRFHGDRHEPALDLKVARELGRTASARGGYEPGTRVRTFSSATWAFAPMTILGPGSWMLLPAALRFACQIRFIASPPSWIASLEPVVAVPIALCVEGACQRSASMDTQRSWMI
jgi:hypothetical protein